jgi:hypothetical protein
MESASYCILLQIVCQDMPISCKFLHYNMFVPLEPTVICPILRSICHAIHSQRRFSQSTLNSAHILTQCTRFLVVKIDQEKKEKKLWSLLLCNPQFSILTNLLDSQQSHIGLFPDYSFWENAGKTQLWFFTYKSCSKCVLGSYFPYFKR